MKKGTKSKIMSCTYSSTHIIGAFWEQQSERSKDSRFKKSKFATSTFLFFGEFQ